MGFNSQTASAAGKASSRMNKPNKETQLLRERVRIILDDNWDEVCIEIKALKGKDLIDCVLRLLEFSLPKLSRTEVRDVSDIETLLSMSPEERQAEIMRLRK
ncbi:MAG: hypothetical protein O2887_17990 [Bacteroidetes bacterium]|nr:hypothetical protein [Bacteroidota bacterium]MDA1122347.1 hypothetical protein [Bacteroidota bacterium]